MTKLFGKCLLRVGLAFCSMGLLPASALEVALPTLLHSFNTRETWDVQGDGSLAEGSVSLGGNNQVFDDTGGFVLAGFPEFPTAQVLDVGRTLLIGPADLNGLEVHRKLYIAPEGKFIRYMDILHNPGSTSIVHRHAITCSLTEGQNHRIRGSYTGALAVSADEHWLAMSDFSPRGMAFALSNPGGAIQAGSFDLSEDVDLTWHYDLTVAPDETVILLYFGVQESNNGDEVAHARDIMGFKGQVLKHLSPQEFAQVINWELNPLVVENPPDLFAYGEGEERADPAFYAFDLTNLFTNDIPWTAYTTADWLTLSSTNGLLPPVGKASIIARINLSTNLLTVGEHTGSVIIQQPDTGHSVTNEVRLRYQGEDRRIYFQDFNGGLDDLVFRGDWEVGVPTSGPMASLDGSPLAATNLDGDYSSDTFHSIAIGSFPTFELPFPRYTLQLSFDEWFETEAEQDIIDVHHIRRGEVFGYNARPRSGSSDGWQRTAHSYRQIDEEAGVGLKLISNDTLTAAGWYVDNVEVSVDGPEPLEVSILDVESADFPSVVVNARIKSYDGLVTNLPDSIYIKEDELPQIASIAFIAPASPQNTRPIDFVFVVDQSGAMDPFIGLITPAVSNFVHQVARASANAIFVMPCFDRRRPNFDGADLVDVGSPTRDPQRFMEDVWPGRVCATGTFQWTDTREAVLSLAEHPVFRPGAQRVVIVFSMAEARSDEEDLRIVNWAEETGTRIYSYEYLYYGDGYPTYIFEKMTEGTGGRSFAFEHSLDPIFEDAALSGYHQVRFQSSRPTWRPDARRIDLSTDYAGKQADVFTTYIPRDYPIVVRSEEDAEGGVRLWWHSTPGCRYRILTGDDLAEPFGIIQTNVLSTPPINEYVIPNASSVTSGYYRVEAVDR